MEARRELQDEGKLQVVERDYFGKLQKRPVITTTPNYYRLTEEQKDLMDKSLSENPEMSSRRDLG
ncbi:MAG: hypothetical protein ACREOO_15285 [bacterium]